MTALRFMVILLSIIAATEMMYLPTRSGFRMNNGPAFIRIGSSKVNGTGSTAAAANLAGLSKGKEQPKNTKHEDVTIVKIKSPAGIIEPLVVTADSDMDEVWKQIEIMMRSVPYYG